MPFPDPTHALRIPPGRRERAEHWSATGVRMKLDGRSSFTGTRRRIWFAYVAVLGALSAAVALFAILPEPAPPAALACTADLRWTPACQALAPDPLADAVDPPELSRRLAATWDFGPDNGLWRAGSAPFHLVQRARWLRSGNGDPALRAKVATSLATVLEPPVSYGSWQADRRTDVAQTAEAVAALYGAEADARWQAHLDSIRTAHQLRLARRAAWQTPIRALAAPLLLAWFALAAIVGVLLLRSRRSERRLELALEPHRLVLDGVPIPVADIASLTARWGAVELRLQDGSSWRSRPLSPRNPARLELLFERTLHASGAASGDRGTRQQLVEALSDVLTRASR